MTLDIQRMTVYTINDMIQKLLRNCIHANIQCFAIHIIKTKTLSISLHTLVLVKKAYKERREIKADGKNII